MSHSAGAGTDGSQWGLCKYRRRSQGGSRRNGAVSSAVTANLNNLPVVTNLRKYECCWKTVERLLYKEKFIRELLFSTIYFKIFPLVTHRLSPTGSAIYLKYLFSDCVQQNDLSSFTRGPFQLYFQFVK